jgi:Na+-driven multidrug efflux pump
VSSPTSAGPQRGPTAELLRLTWPAALSFLLGSAYRINDQFWIQGLGESAQSATAAVLFVAIMNFSAAILAAGGALSLVARAVGAQDLPRAQRVARHAIGFAIVLGLGSSRRSRCSWRRPSTTCSSGAGRRACRCSCSSRPSG